MLKQNFAIGIPTFNRYDLLVQFLDRYADDFPGTEFYIYDNGAQQIPSRYGSKDLHVYGGVYENIGVAASWNFLLRKIYEQYDYALILNDDIYLGAKENAIAAFLRSEGHKYHLMRCPMDWCAFILPKRTFETIGPFDEAFYPAYLEDIDYERRLKLAVGSIMQLPLLVPSVYRTSQTLEKEPALFYNAQRLNKKRYVEKWGGTKGHEIFKKPFDGKQQ